MLAILSTTKNQIANIYWIVTEKALATHSSALACKNTMNGGAWAEVHGVAKSQTWLSVFTFTSHFHALEKEMATHSSVLVWRIPGMEKPGRTPSMGSHRVGHNWRDIAAAGALDYHIYIDIKDLCFLYSPHVIHYFYCLSNENSLTLLFLSTVIFFHDFSYLLFSSFVFMSIILISPKLLFHFKFLVKHAQISSFFFFVYNVCI